MDMRALEYIVIATVAERPHSRTLPRRVAAFFG
jgi:hypothetical protein